MSLGVNELTFADQYGGEPGRVGTYTFYGLEPGTYTVGFNEPYGFSGNQGGLGTTYFGGAATLEGAQPITLAAGDRRTGVDARLAYSGGTISGVLKDVAGRPIAFAEVYGLAADRVFDHDETPIRASSGVRATTDSAGRFTLRTMGAPVKLRFDQDGGGYVSEFFDDTTAWEDARVLDADPGAAITGITGVLQPVTVKNTSRPGVRGVLFNGATASADPGEWSHHAASYTYRWFRAGTAKPIGTGPKLKITSASIGKKLTVEVTARQAGVVNVVATSPASAAVKRASTVTFTASSSSRGKVTFKVSLAVTGVRRPSGKVAVSCGLASRTVSVSKGKVTATLSGVPRGRVTCTAVSRATSKVAADKAPSRSVKVR